MVIEKKRHSTTRLALRLLRLLWGLSPGALVLLLVLTLARAAYPPLELTIFRSLINLMTGSRPAIPGTYIWLALLLGIRILGHVLETQWVNLYQTLELRVNYALQKQFLSSSGSMSLSFMEKREHYDPMHKARTAISSGLIHQAIFDSIELLQLILTTAVYSAMLLRIGWPIIFLVVLAVSPQSWIQSLKNRIGYGFYLQNTPEERRSWYLLDIMTSVRPAKEIRVYELLPYLKAEWQRRFERLRRLHLGHERRFGFLDALMAATSQGLIGISFLIVIRSIYSGRLLLGDYKEAREGDGSETIEGNGEL